MKPILTPDELRAADERAMAVVSLETLVERAGTALAHVARTMIAPVYGKRIVVVCGKGNNGADGRVAARKLSQMGGHCTIVEPDPDLVLGACDLVIDAAFGTGFRGEFCAPTLTGNPLVLACDLPSGLDAITGASHGTPLEADVTATFVAPKPGLVLALPTGVVGRVVVCDLGIDPGVARAALVESSDLNVCFRLDRAAHKWKSAVTVIAGTPEMAGAGGLCAAGAQRAGAGMVRLVTSAAVVSGASEAVLVLRPERGWLAAADPSIARSGALVVGPGLGRSPEISLEVANLVANTALPLVLDADGLSAFTNATHLGEAIAQRPAQSVVITPHDGEYTQLVGHLPGADRFRAARELAQMTGAIVLLKGPVTIVASPLVDEPILVVADGPPTLATAGTGDVLSGIIGALLARFPRETLAWAAAMGAMWHAQAARCGPPVGLVASDLPALLPAVALAIDEGAR